MTRVLVTGDCQAEHLARALTAVAPRFDVSAMMTARTDPTDLDTLPRTLQTMDIWVRIQVPQDAWAVPLAPHRLRTIEIPSLVFDGFHPDITVAIDAEGQVAPSALAYSSSIALWAWRHGLSPEEAAALFTGAVMTRLGYLASFELAHRRMQEEFAPTPLDMAPVFARLRGLGSFMHTFNHPRLAYFTLLARAIAEHAGEPVDWDEPIEDILEDTTGVVGWPVYPFLAQHLGIPGNYRWRSGSLILHTLDDYLSASWGAYAAHDPVQLRDGRRSDEVLDRVLLPATSGL